MVESLFFYCLQIRKIMFVKRKIPHRRQTENNSACLEKSGKHVVFRFVKPTESHSSSIAMAGFPIFDLNPVFMEKVINKVFLFSTFFYFDVFQLKEKSYFRIQQTCRGMGEFIRNSSNISVLIGGIYYPFWDDERQCYAFNSTSYSGRYPVEALYGTKIRSIESG